ncbi:Uncharacterised protein [Mycobacteroides abscessus]|nr:Uncharacterised protein [Mycobacteroides abscessus]
MPHGVVPPAQLLSVPSTRVPDGSATVLTRSDPATGPVRRNSVVRCTRRLYRLSAT